MTFSRCSREKEVAELLALGHWPQACTQELLGHVYACRDCGDLVLVSMAFQRARADAASIAHVSSPGALWWRAQLRRRNAAVERVGKPLLGAQIFALAVNLLVVAGFLVWQAKSGLQWLSWLEELPQSGGIHLEVLWPSALLGSGWSLMALIPALATLALLSGVVVYLATEKQ
ncbi:MAG: hypothetical protein ABR924_04565 [Terracidiphilus sp.]|jgi:hypothetical protein